MCTKQQKQYNKKKKCHMNRDCQIMLILKPGLIHTDILMPLPGPSEDGTTYDSILDLLRF